MFTSTYKNTKKFGIEILKRNRSGKLDVEKYPCIEGFSNPNIQERYNLAPKTLPVDNAYMFCLYQIIFRVKIKSLISEIVIVEQYEGIFERSVLDGVCYQELKTFNKKYIHNHVGFNIFHGMSPSAQLKIKF